MIEYFILYLSQNLHQSKTITIFAPWIGNSPTFWNKSVCLSLIIGNLRNFQKMRGITQMVHAIA